MRWLLLVVLLAGCQGESRRAADVERQRTLTHDRDLAAGHAPADWSRLRPGTGSVASP